MYENEIKIQQRIKETFEKLGDESEVAYDIAFHMTDWLSDIKDMEAIYSNIDRVTSDEITSFVYKFLAHVPNHLNAAYKLVGFGKIEDVFQVGIFEDDE